MKYLLLTVLVFSLVTPVCAKVIELGGVTSESTGGISALSGLYLTLGSKSETEMMHDNGVTYWSHNGLQGQATTFTAPADCHLVRLKYYLRNAGHTYNHDCYRDVGGTPDHTDSYFSAPISYNPGTVDWHEIDVTDEGVTFSNGEVFHPYMDDLSVSGTSDDQGTISGGSGGPDGSNWWHFTNDTWSAYHVLFGASSVRAFIDDDMAGPYAADQNPADGATGVAVDADILFDIQDDDVGVDGATITTSSVVVTDDTKATITGTLTVDDTDPNDVHVTFDPDSDFVEVSVVTVTVSPTGDEILDDLGNEMAEDSWSFTVVAAGVESASLGEIKANFK